MNKKLKIFIKVIYYIFTIGLGILLAFILPGMLMTSDLPGHLENYLNNGEFARSVNLLAGFDDIEIAYQETFDDGSGIVLFRTMVLIDNPKNNQNQTTSTADEVIQEDSAYFAYSGFLYNLQGKYKTNKAVNNKTKLIANKNEDYKEGKGKGDDLTSNVEIELLGFDSDGDGLYDDVVTLQKYNYVYFEVLEKRTKNITKLTFVDCDGNDVVEVSNLSLDFTNVFYTSLVEFRDVYNKNSKDEKLVDLQKKFLESSENYEKCSYQQETVIASKKGAYVILVYFIIIYILGDCLVGQRFIIRFIKWIIKKIRKKMGKEDEEPIIEEVYGSDYYTTLTMHLDVPEDCDINISVHYHNETDQIDMTFTKDSGYKVTQRIHAGVYVNAWLEAPGYVSCNLPKTLQVRGFKMDVEVSLRKALENENNPTE